MTRWTPSLLLLFAVHLVTIPLGAATELFTRPHAPGVALELTPDYG